MLVRHRFPGFTLVELLVVIAIIGVLVSLLLPAVQSARESARRTQCNSNIKQLVMALHSYNDSHGVFPPGAMKPTGTARSNELSWHVLILPLIEQRGLHEQFDFNASGYLQPSVLALAMERPKLYLCPSAPRTTYRSGYAPEVVNGQPVLTTHYFGVMGPKGMNSWGPAGPVNYRWQNVGTFAGYAQQGILGLETQFTFADILDGSSNTFMVGEISWAEANCYRAWLRGSSSGYPVASCKNINYPIKAVPYNGVNNFNDTSFGSEHPGGCHFTMCDGAVRFVNESVDMAVYKATASINGREPEVVR